MASAASALAVGCALATAAIAGAEPQVPGDAISCPGRALDSCYRSDQMYELAGAGRGLVNEYLTQVGITGDALPKMTFIPSGSSVSSQCVDLNADSTQHDRSFDYCPADDTVYVGQNSLWDSYLQFGAAGPISGLAHEYGHFFQDVTGVPSPVGDAETIRHEDQADCFSGAFISHLRDLGEVQDPADIERIYRYLTTTASVEAPGRDHGTARERIEWFELGYHGALPACG